MITHQANKPCPKCGSMYRNKVCCNKCNEDLSNFDTEIATIEYRTAKGRMWSKKLGRYLTQSEVKSGKKGG